MNEIKKLTIATPVVWAESGLINHFAGMMDQLITSINEIAQRCGEPFKVEGAFMDIQSTSRNEILAYPQVELDATARSVDERGSKGKGMAYWWYAAVEKAMNRGSSFLVYWPPDTSWEQSMENTVVNPSRVCGMLKGLLNTSGDTLMLGNYTSTNPQKEFIEQYVLSLLREAYRQRKNPIEIPQGIKRPRTEFWGIGSQLFRAFTAALPQSNELRKVADPSLLLLVYCLDTKKPILTYDLGSYKAEGAYTNENIIKQVERARDLLQTFVGRFS